MGKILFFAAAFGLLGGCASTNTESLQESGFSGAYAIVRAPGNIPGIPESNGKTARWSQIEVKQIDYLDLSCKEQMFKQLPGWAQAIAEESGWAALATAVGEYGFASAFPGVDTVRYFLGGLGYGAFAGINTARIRQDGSKKSSQSICVMQLIQDTNARYHALEGIYAVPWVGDGRTTLPPATDPLTAPMLKHVDVGVRPY